MIKINLQKAKQIAHNFRRAKRETEFEQHDTVIMKQIPGNDYDRAEQARQAIREKYALLQDEIDACEDENQLKEIFNSL